MPLHQLVTYVWRHPLNAPGRIAALGRVARWQVASRIMDCPIAMPFVDETLLLMSRGMTGATGNWYCGLHEFRDMGFVLHALRPDDRFLDVGANVGSYTILAAGGVGARVTAVEPIAVTVEKLRRNVRLNGLSAKVTVVQCGLSDSAGTLRFTCNLDTTNRVLSNGEGTNRSVTVPVRTLDEVVGGDAPAVIKIDVEGYEALVLRGATRTLADPRLLAVVTEVNASGRRYGVRDDQLTAAMREHGFSPFAYDPFRRRLTDVSMADSNIVFVRDRAAVQSRATSARRYKLVNGEL
jgi:FkbM family methyltransferase